MAQHHFVAGFAQMLPMNPRKCSLVLAEEVMHPQDG